MHAWLSKLLNLRRGEATPVLVSSLFFFCVLTALMVLRPAREALGMQRGMDAIRWLFIGTAASSPRSRAPSATRPRPSSTPSSTAPAM